MGTREDLLVAAKQCLAERGYARTTVRDIVAASGTNLAAINYHFGTRDKLLNQAMLESTATAVHQIFVSLPETAGGDPAARLDAFWHKLIASFEADRALWTANAESTAQALHNPEIRAESAAAQRDARVGLSNALGQADLRIGSILNLLITGVLIQWLIDADNAPTPQDLSAGLRALVDMIGPARTEAETPPQDS
ncbi:TetR/AcrR family transcriptional regulator [Nocardia panacis]|uniref:TetR/AcrR family transcriptional regulator n=1 Tax=Nocardia panacis TaxID=2340916 RepID=A0A3A4KM12_9NOCA|nr:TetR/AcrR family transcriptional regulator [Nocardia panacis]RJO76598.1 TetR/AcrR family transcriptional regulator [Nocardia panacis]